MKRSTIAQMICPYCLESFSIIAEIEGDATRVEYGLVKCGCFEFPIIEGILLLSLSKGYGGAEEKLQPYVALQTAAIILIKKSALAALKSWMRKMTPLVFRLCSGATEESYLTFIKSYDQELNAAAESFLYDEGKYGFIGTRKQMPTKDGSVLENWYAARFITPRTAYLRDEIFSLNPRGPVLSLCCGHGVAENLLQTPVRGDEIISIDGQLINLLVVRKFINSDGDFICHDLQFPLPFKDAYFRFSVSSTCLPEIPSHATVVKEALRVTSADGCALFDSIWVSPTSRIDPLRYYRFCQNEFENKETIIRLFVKCCAQRFLAFSQATGSSKPMWTHGADDFSRVIAHSTDRFMSAVVGCSSQQSWAESVDLTEPEINALYLSPLYGISEETQTTIRVFRGGETYGESLVPRLAECFPRLFVIKKSELFNSRYVSMLFRIGIVSLLPGSFGGQNVSIAALRSDSMPDCPMSA
jgi:ubiquinone/menaquinone biosynthesis C-methylase UbiE